MWKAFYHLVRKVKGEGGGGGELCQPIVPFKVGRQYPPQK